MKKLPILLFMSILTFKQAKAQDPVAEVIKAAVIKAIKALDLKIQRIQNRTIWLQNAQKTIENTMSKLKLDEITDWVERQRQLYKDYYDELWQVKNVISYSKRIKDISRRQVLLVEEYKRVWRLLRADKHFTEDELSYMEKVYSGILSESLKNLEQIFFVVKSFTMQISDAKRLELINAAADQAEINYNDLKAFNQQNMIMSLQRAKSVGDVQTVKNLYGLN